MIDWLELLVRWLHVVAGIAWIGSSFYFIFLDASLRRRDDMDEALAGESWQVHGGGFYRMRKYLVAPDGMPPELHWFKYEAYTTWLSGFLLLALIYYLKADIYLIDNRVMELSQATAIGAGVGSLVIGWLLYDGLCRLFQQRNTLLGIVGFALVIAAFWGYAQVFGGRGAYIHSGVLIGTLMAANVFFVIIPNQKKVVANLLAGKTPKPELGKQAKQRSLHNNYLTLPVVFVMLSAHYPMTYASPWNWAILGGVFLAGGVVRHFFNQKHAGRGEKWWLWVLAAAIFAAIIASASLTTPDRESADTPDFSKIRSIIDQRCVSCHSVSPSQPGFDAPPLDVRFDTDDEIIREAARIQTQTIATSSMPLGNITGMTNKERDLIAAWIAAGAPGKEQP